VVTWRCRSPRTFFGLSDNYIESVYDQFFLMKYYGGWSFTEAYNLPVKIRLWFFTRLGKEKEKEKEAVEKAQQKKGTTTPTSMPNYPRKIS